MRIFDCKNNPGIETGVMGQQRVGTTIGRVFIISTIIYIAITVQLRWPGITLQINQNLKLLISPQTVSFGVFPAAMPHASMQFYDNNALPELPSVPDTMPNSSVGGHTTSSSDDIDFDDLSRRFEELKKKT